MQQCKWCESQCTKKRKLCIEKDTQAVDARVPLRILKLNNEFDLSRERYANWPQPINKTVANEALAEFRENIKCDSLRELCCAVCSGLYPCEHLSIISMQEIRLLLLEASKYIVEKSFLENDFVCKHPCMDGSNHKVLLDRTRAGYHQRERMQQCKWCESQCTKKRKLCIEKDTQAVDARVPLRILKLNNEFDLSRERYANWPQPINKTVANEALAEFRENIKCDSLRELCCAVCSGLYPCEHLSIISMQEIRLLLLEASKYIVEKSFLENDFVCKHPCMDGSNHKVLLDRSKFVNNNISNRDENLFDIQIGTTPQCLQGLTILEQLLISVDYICINIIQLTNQKHTHHKLKGQPSEEQLKKVLCVRRNKIASALEWLIVHNILYKNVRFDKTTLESLPENEVPVALLATTVLININSKKVEHYTGYVTDPIDEDNINNNSSDIYDEELNNNEDTTKLYNSIGGLTELRSSGITYVNNTLVSEQERTLKLLEKMTQELTDNKQVDSSHTILMPHSNIPKNEYTDPTLLPATFPTLFPYGIGDHEDDFCKQYISFKQYIKHLLRLRDPKLRYHRSFIFAVFDMLRRRKVASGTYLMAKINNQNKNDKHNCEKMKNKIRENIDSYIVEDVEQNKEYMGKSNEPGRNVINRNEKKRI
ncbi:hypothetical protein Glove_65g123 [Diversispora epigaea]|uniref:DUF6570 domain-containing protein n=1 Tax=Diversispora epigaea TaxID=1348612 RepID=A0A397JD01_9GLOM|nr:hypothetical protein Glove_65g123 [Diversispora epigaea]